jgi:molybdopterin-guanine dinucleotide biosynthesis adapter protein
VKAIGFVGASGSGKTTLIERLIPALTARGLTVSALKHAHHGFDMDRPGKDSFRFRQAGAAQVLVAAPQRWALLTELRDRPSTLEDLLAQLDRCDLVLVEGFRSEGSIPRIEVRGAAVDPSSEARSAKEDESPEVRSSAVDPSPFAQDANLVAVVCDDPVDRALPRFARDDVANIASFILRTLGIGG